MRIFVSPYQLNHSSLLPVDVANTQIVNHVESVYVCQFVHTFLRPLQRIVIRDLGFSNSGEKNVIFERKNWQSRRGFGGNAPKTDGIRDVRVRASSFLYI